MDNNNSNNNNSNKPNNKVNMPKFNLNWMYMIIALMLLGLWWGSDSKGAGSKAVTYSEFQDYVKKGYVSKVLGYEDKSIEAFLKPTAVGAVFGADSTKVGRNPVITSRTPSTDKLEEFLQAEKEAGHFDGSSDYPPKSDIFPAILIQVLPLVLLVALWIFFMRRMSGGGSGGPGGVFNVGKSKAQLFEKGGAIKITFKDVAGLAEAKQEVEEIVEFLKEPQKYTDLGGKIPQGALLVGPPGTVGMTGAGGVIGLVSSLVGIGGGTLSVPFLLWHNVEMRKAIGTAAAIGFPNAVTGCIGYLINGWGAAHLPPYSLGYVYLPALLGIVAVSMIAAPLGARLAQRLPVPKLKRCFAVLLIAVGLKMLYSAVF